jgi:hypothetical protein
MKPECGRTVGRPLQYEQEHWVSMVSIRNIEIMTYKNRWRKKEDTPYAIKKSLPYIYC